MSLACQQPHVLSDVNSCVVCLQALQSLLALHKFKLGADSAIFNQDYVDPQQPAEALSTGE